MVRISVVVFLLTAVSLAQPSKAQDFTGTVVYSDRPGEVIDGDTIRIGDLKIRIVWIDAPEKNGYATELLRLVLSPTNGKIGCVPFGADRYRRIVAMCGTNEISDVGLWLIEQGFARTWGDAPDLYFAAERQAREQGSGLWGCDHITPSEWMADKLISC